MHTGTGGENHRRIRLEGHSTEQPAASTSGIKRRLDPRGHGGAGVLVAEHECLRGRVEQGREEGGWPYQSQFSRSTVTILDESSVQRGVDREATGLTHFGSERSGPSVSVIRAMSIQSEGVFALSG